MRKLGFFALWIIILLVAGCAPTITGPIVEEAPPTITGNNQGSVGTSAPQQTTTEQEKIEPGWVLHLFAPAKEDRKKMCAIGYKDGLKGEHSYTPPSADFRLKNGGWLSFTPSLSETYYYCYNRAQDGEEMPADPPLEPAFIQIYDPKFIKRYSSSKDSSRYVWIDLKSYDQNDTKGYRAMGFLFTVKQKTWRVLFPLPRSEGGLYIPGPKVENFLHFFPGVYAYGDYVNGKTYLYIGMNYKRMSSNLKRLITMADSFAFLLSRGYGVELFKISKDRFPDL